MTRRLISWAFVVASLALTVWGVVSFVAPTATCRGVEMHAGDVCSYSSYTQEETEFTQTYEQRINASRRGAPIGIVVGLAAAAFGVVVLRRPQAPSDIGP